MAWRGSAVGRARAAGAVLLAAAACALAVVSVRSALSSSPPTMRLDPATLKVVGTAERTFTVDVVIDEVADLGGFEFELHFDGSYLNVTDIREGPFLGSGGGDTTCIENTLLEGQATFGCLLKGKPGVSGSGVVSEIDFALKYQFGALIELRLMGCDAADSQGVPITLNGCKDASVTVNAPTPTPPPVGGISRDADVAAAAGGDARSADGRSALAEAIAAAATGGLALAALGLYVGRRLVP